MGTTDHPFPGPDNPEAAADAPPHEPSTDGDGAVPAAATGGELDAPLAAEPALDGAAHETHEPDVMSEFRCIAAAEPEPAWTSQRFEVFVPPAARVEPDERTDQAVEQTLPEAPPSEPDHAAPVTEPEIEVVATVQPQSAEPEPAADAVAGQEPEPVVFSPAVAQPPVDAEPPAAIEAASSPAITDAWQAPVEPEPEAAPVPEPDPVAEAVAVAEPDWQVPQPGPAADPVATGEPESPALSLEAAQPAVDAEPPAAIAASLDPAIIDNQKTSVALVCHHVCNPVTWWFLV
jgi:hypothetical protein